MANRLRIRMIPFASPGDIELKYATKVGGESATLAHYKTQATAVAKEDGNDFLECELAANTPYPVGAGGSGGPNVSGSEAQTYLLNITQVQEVTEY